MIAYKYCTWDKFSKRIITNQELYFNDPFNFNDPFECNTYGVFGKYDKADFRYGLNKRGAIRRILDIALEYLHNLREADLHRFGICCFSKKDDTILMWSHYADYHKGVCFGIDLDEVINDRVFYMPVYYVLQKPRFDFTNNEEDVLKWLLYKYKAWRYEQEIRLIKIPSKNRGIRRKVIIPKSAIKEVIFGAKMEMDDQISIRHLCMECGLNARFYMMQDPKTENFELKKAEIKILSSK